MMLGNTNTHSLRVLVCVCALTGVVVAACAGASAPDDKATTVMPSPNRTEPVAEDGGEESPVPATAPAEPSQAFVHGGMEQVPLGEQPWTAGGGLEQVAYSTFGAQLVDGVTTTMSFEIEQGLDVDSERFARFVLDTVNDERSWRHDGYHFDGVDSGGNFRVVLASPELSQQLCRPLNTLGTLSCRNGNTVVFTAYRWASGHPDYADDLVGYRRYLVNHEIGHFLGHGHVPCPGQGQQAPAKASKPRS